MSGSERVVYAANSQRDSSPQASASGLVVECAGCPGSGKTTLVRSLLAMDNSFRRYKVNSWDVIKGMCATLRVLPMALRQLWLNPKRPFKRIKLILLLEIMYARALRAKTTPGVTLLLDQGPVYCLPILMRMLTPIHNHVGFVGYVERCRARWAELLDVVIVLEGADELLRGRITSRGTAHRLIGLGEVETSAALRRARENREALLNSWREGSTPVIHYLDSGQSETGVRARHLIEHSNVGAMGAQSGAMEVVSGWSAHSFTTEP